MNKMPDSRQAWKIKHKLSDILIICVLVITCNANTAVEIYDFAVARKKWDSKSFDFLKGVTDYPT